MEWIVNRLAFKLTTKVFSLYNVIMAAMSCVIFVGSLYLLFRTGYNFMALTLLYLAALGVGLLYAAFKVEYANFGGAFLAFEDVGKMQAVVLRRRLTKEKTKGSEDWQTSKDVKFYRSFGLGLIVYSPWFWKHEGVVNLEPFILPQRPIAVNAADGPLTKVDTKVTFQVTGPIFYTMNVGNKEQKRNEIIGEQLGMALEYVTSVYPDQDVYIEYEDEEGKIVGDSIKPWESNTQAVAGASDEVKKRMTKYATHLVNLSLEEKQFGFELLVEVTQFESPAVVRKAQEAAASAELEANEAKTQARGYASMIEQLMAAGSKGFPPELVDSLTKVIGDADATPELKQSALEVLRKSRPDPTVLTAIVTAMPAVRDVMQQWMGGRVNGDRKNEDKGDNEGKPAGKKPAQADA